MENIEKHLNDLREIRSIMEKSARFIGLSGLSGISAGICALFGAAAAYKYLGISPFELDTRYDAFTTAIVTTRWGLDYIKFFILDGLLTAGIAIASAIFFTTRHARKKGQTVFDRSAIRLIYNLAIPLFFGGLFCIALLIDGQLGYIPPATLVFYGLALVNGSKFTLPELLYLGIIEAFLGIIGMFLMRFGIELWVVGFGFLHIIYGALMYFRYERQIEK